MRNLYHKDSWTTGWHRIWRESPDKSLFYPSSNQFLGIWSVGRSRKSQWNSNHMTSLPGTVFFHDKERLTWLWSSSSCQYSIDRSWNSPSLCSQPLELVLFGLTVHPSLRTSRNLKSLRSPTAIECAPRFKFLNAHNKFTWRLNFEQKMKYCRKRQKE